MLSTKDTTATVCPYCLNPPEVQPPSENNGHNYQFFCLQLCIESEAPAKTLEEARENWDELCNIERR